MQTPESKRAAEPLFLIMTPSGPVPNHLPYALGVKIIDGGNESRRNSLFGMIILISEIVK
jgi:hypothetical protein